MWKRMTVFFSFRTSFCRAGDGGILTRKYPLFSQAAEPVFPGAYRKNPSSGSLWRGRCTASDLFQPAGTAWGFSEGQRYPAWNLHAAGTGEGSRAGLEASERFCAGTASGGKDCFYRTWNGFQSGSDRGEILLLLSRALKKVIKTTEHHIFEVGIRKPFSL